MYRTLKLSDAGSSRPLNQPVVSYSVPVAMGSANISAIPAVGRFVETQDSQKVTGEGFTINSQEAVRLTPETQPQLNVSSTNAIVAEPPVRTTVKTPLTDSTISQDSADSSNESDLKNSAGSDKKVSLLKKILITGMVTGLLGFAGISGYQAFSHFTSHEETEDAYTTGHQHQISTRINGTVDAVLVDDNEHVKKGQVLAILDPRDYEVRVAQAQAALELSGNQAEAAKSSIVFSSTTATGKSTEAEAGVADSEAAVTRAEGAFLEAQAVVPQAEADVRAKVAEETRAKADSQRFISLANEGAVSYQQRDSAVRDYEVAKSSREASDELLKQSKFKLVQATQAVKMAKAQVNQSKGLVQQADATHVQTQVNEKQLDVAKSSIHQSQAQLQDAQLQLSYTKIVSPVDGRIGRKTVEPGQRVQPGQQLMTIVADDIWVVANFKETQLERMRPQQPVEIKIDSYPHHAFAGTIDSVSPGSGASFALLPPDNATGNFTKIVQRVPVKIRFDRSSIKGFENLLVPGMSAIVSVDVQDGAKIESSSALADGKTGNLIPSSHG